MLQLTWVLWLNILLNLFMVHLSLCYTSVAWIKKNGRLFHGTHPLVFCMKVYSHRFQSNRAALWYDGKRNVVPGWRAWNKQHKRWNIRKLTKTTECIHIDTNPINIKNITLCYYGLWKLKVLRRIYVQIFFRSKKYCERQKD